MDLSDWMFQNWATHFWRMSLTFLLSSVYSMIVHGTGPMSRVSLRRLSTTEPEELNSLFRVQRIQTFEECYQCVFLFFLPYTRTGTEDPEQVPSSSPCSTSAWVSEYHTKPVRFFNSFPGILSDQVHEMSALSSYARLASHEPQVKWEAKALSLTAHRRGVSNHTTCTATFCRSAFTTSVSQFPLNSEFPSHLAQGPRIKGLPEYWPGSTHRVLLINLIISFSL